MEMISTFMPGLGHWWWKKVEIQEQKDDIFQIMQSPNIFGSNYFISWLITIWVIDRHLFGGTNVWGEDVLGGHLS